MLLLTALTIFCSEVLELNEVALGLLLIEVSILGSAEIDL